MRQAGACLDRREGQLVPRQVTFALLAVLGEFKSWGRLSEADAPRIVVTLFAWER
jgi:hypothetical protein